MKIFIALACFVAAGFAAPGYDAAKPHVVNPELYIKKNINEFPKNAFWETYVAKLTNSNQYTILQIAKLTIAFFDSAAGEIDDIFPDQSYKLAIYQVSQIFSFPSGTSSEQALNVKVVHAYAAVSAWGAADAQATAIVDLLLTLTNKVFHHYIVYDQGLEDSLEVSHRQIGSSSATGADKDIAEASIKFVLSFARKAVKACYSSYREDIVEGTDAILLCEAFAYSTRGFPYDTMETKQDMKKRDFFKEIIDKISSEARNDLKEFIFESIGGIEGYKTCIIEEAKALNTGFHDTMNHIHKDILKPIATPPPMQTTILPLTSFEVPTQFAAVGSRS